MLDRDGPSTARHFVFAPTPAVAESRARRRYVNCSLCNTDQSSYLFHRTGVRFVRCNGCGLVYKNPIGEAAPNYFDIQRAMPFVTPVDRALCVRDFDAFLEQLEERYRASTGAPIERLLLLGRALPEFLDLERARRLRLSTIVPSDAEFRALALESSLDWARAELTRQPPVVVLNEFLEACSEPARVLSELVARLAPGAWIVVTYANTESVPARLMRRYWPHFFEVKSAFFNAHNLSVLLSKSGYGLVQQFPFPTTRSAGYVLTRLRPGKPLTRALLKTPLRTTPAPLRSGHQVAVFRPTRDVAPAEKLSIILPAFNEERYIATVIDAVLEKSLEIDRELIIVESNSRDRTRDIVLSYQGRPGVRVLLEDRPRGKGHAVRTGLAAATGSIILIQDADFEYDIDDYDALLEPLLQRRAHFVLGSRSLGLDDWKVRQYAANPLKALSMNVAQVAFAKTFNWLYQQRTTDVNTMFKVFRRECLDGVTLEGNGFELDIELVCKIVKNGYAPLEVPVNYVSRGFDEGKKIDFWRDAFPSYAAFFKYRFE